MVIHLLLVLITCVYIGVFLHVGLLVEPLATVLTGVGSGVTVDKHVCVQCGGALEAFSTFLTAERTVRRELFLGRAEQLRVFKSHGMRYLFRVVPESLVRV